MNKLDILEYLNAFKNPLDKKWRWEVNTYLRKNKINEREAENLLRIDKKSAYELMVVVRNKIPVDNKQISAFYLRQATRLYEQKQKRYYGHNKFS